MHDNPNSWCHIHQIVQSKPLINISTISSTVQITLSKLTNFYLAPSVKLFNLEITLKHSAKINFIKSVTTFLLSSLVVIPGEYSGLVAVSVRELDMIADLHRNRRRIVLNKPFHQSFRLDLRRRSPASGGHKLVGRRNNGTAKYTQHFPKNQK